MPIHLQRNTGLLRALGLALWLGLASAATPVLAEGYALANLGPIASRETCMLKAELAMQSYFQKEGGLSVTKSDWSVYGWDFRPGDQDVVILCPLLEDGQAQAILVVHGETSKRHRTYTKDQLLRYFNR